MKWTRYAYTPLFDPDKVSRPEGDDGADVGDRSASAVYVYDDEIVLRVNVALATRRPLLVRGESGSGKSSLARNIAAALRWRLYTRVITSRTEAQHLLWEVDLLRRLQDAQARGRRKLSDDLTPYLQPGVLWWAFDPSSAARRGAARRTKGVPLLADPNEGWTGDRAVVLLDEIDKADPDVPNNLLVPLGSLRFQVEETGASVRTTAERAPLILITTNEERELPKAFLRRCVELTLKLPRRGRLIDIGHAHHPELPRAEIEKTADALLGPGKDEDEPEISPAAFLDTIAGLNGLAMEARGPAFEALAQTTVWKHGRDRRSRAT